MRRLFVPASIVLLSFAGAVPAVAGGNANFVLGPRSVGGHDFWRSEGHQSAAGVIVDFGKENWPIHIALADIDSTSGSDNFHAAVSERALGVMKVWEFQSAVRPYLGAGVALVRGSFTTETSTGDLVQDDSTVGYCFDGGVFWRTGRRFNIGFGARLMTGTGLEIQGVDGDADYHQYHILAGFGWPRREKP